jgi:hypothetical protein
VTLRVRDNGPSGQVLEDTETTNVMVTNPPVAPTADAGGPYNFCTNRTPWFLDGTKSRNPDEGISEGTAYPRNTIIEYSWNLNGDTVFGDAAGSTPDVSGSFGIGSYLISLRVTDNSSLSHPNFTTVNLSDVDTAQVIVRQGTDPACSCVSNLLARSKPGKADLTWTYRTGAVKYHVYRGNASGGPYLKIGEATRGVYADFGPLTTGSTYYWVVREAAVNGDELCQSNQTQAVIPAPR